MCIDLTGKSGDENFGLFFGRVFTKICAENRKAIKSEETLFDSHWKNKLKSGKLSRKFRMHQ